MSIFGDSTVRDIMQTDPVTIRPEDSLRSALRTMYEAKVTSLVVDPGDPARGVGIMTQKDLLGPIFDGCEDLDEVTLGELMTSPAVPVSPAYSIETCMRLMRMLGVRRVPVVENDRVIGIVSLADIFRGALEKMI